MSAAAPLPKIEAIRQAYERWAPLYPPAPHNPLMRVEQSAMIELWPRLVPRRALDLACGSGRYTRLLRELGAAEVVAADISTGMLGQVESAGRVCADMSRLPFPDEAFDAVISGLALAHSEDLGAWMAEVARVLTDGGTLLYSDFHPDAACTGLTRSFKDRDGMRATVPQHVHPIAAQLEAARSAGLIVEAVRELRVGAELTEPFAGSDAFYAAWPGLAIVLVVRAAKGGESARSAAACSGPRSGTGSGGGDLP